MGVGGSRHYEIKERIDGKIVVVTGSSSGIGRATAKELYKVGGRVILACIDVSEAEQAAEEIRKEVENSDPPVKVGEMIVKKLDLSSLESVRSCADDLNASEERIDILINNAGILARQRQLTKDGFELTYVTNFLGHFYLTCLLLPKILASAPARIINVSSIAHASGRIHWDDLTIEKNFSMYAAYAQSKLALVMFTRELASRLEGTGVTVYALHPGLVGNTSIANPFTEANRIYHYIAQCIRFLLNPCLKTREQGAATSLFCALDKSIAEKSGFYYKDCAQSEMAPKARNDEDTKRLWAESLKMVGLNDFRIEKNHNT